MNYHLSLLISGRDVQGEEGAGGRQEAHQVRRVERGRRESAIDKRCIKGWWLTARFIDDHAPLPSHLPIWDGIPEMGERRLDLLDLAPAEAQSHLVLLAATVELFATSVSKSVILEAV